MSNALVNESSPYLLQHANNPVNWFAWNEQTLQLAKEQNKMLLISVGYAACHWCHVMEHESFENEEVARVMNENYICIKVDREERPDVDQIYMNAAYLINGNGGWPLNALAMPNGKPFFAGTYFPKDNWIQLLTYFADIYHNERDKLEGQAENVAKGIRDIEHIPRNAEPVSFLKSDPDEMFLSFEKRIDIERGGTKGAMKFPMPSIWEYLLEYHYFSGSKNALAAVEVTLHNMANGGIYDQVGGGFSRYATDSKWHAPHFEKMLYDNGQLVSLYSHAFQLTKNPLYKKVVYETLEFISRELTSPQGGFYSSLDADSEGEEGKYYVWTQQEIGDILQDDQNLYFDLYGITPQGNWEPHKNIPDVNYGTTNLPEKYHLSEDAYQEKIISLNKKLFKEREKRVRPGTDDKILTSWNSLMAVGFIDAYKAFGDADFLKSAKANLDFLIEKVCTKEHSLFRNFKNGKASIYGFLDDYAFLISALIQFYQVSFEQSYLQKALDLTHYVQAHFFDDETGMFLYTDDQHSDLIARKMEVTDNVIPSSNSEMARNLFFLNLYFDNKNFEDQSSQLIKNIFADMKKNLNYYSNWGRALLLHVFPPNEIAIAGEGWKEKLADFNKEYFPANIYCGGIEEGSLSLLKDKFVPGKTMIYVCRNKACGLPVEEVADAIKQIRSSEPLAF